jgi:hypothetical protein
MKLPITIEYNSGESATYIAQPPEWAKWERTTSKTVSSAVDGIGVWDLLFLAYNAMKENQLVSQLKLLKSGWKQFQM